MTNGQAEVVRKRRPSLNDVAVHAGVSQGAVSKVIRNAYGVSPAMRERVQRAIDELGYRPRVGARAMRGQTFTIGLEIPQLGNDFFTQVMRGAAGRLAGTGYQLIIAPSLGGEGGQPVLDALVDRQVDGLIAISPDVTATWLDKLAEYVPVVLLGRHDEAVHYDTVTNDDVVGVNLVMDHLFRLGHTQITHLTVQPAIDVPESRPPHALRLATYSDRMTAAGLTPRISITEAYEPDAYDTAIRMLESPGRPTAIFAGNDTLAIGALRAVADLGLSAGDVSVVGYDDIDLARHPLVSLTTVDQFGVEMGEAAIDLLMERIAGTRTDPRHVQISPQLRIRSSTREAPADHAVRVG